MLSFNFKLYFSVYKLECIDEKDSNYTQNITCFLKTISRGLTVLTILSDIIRPLNYVNMNIVTLQKNTANTFRNVMLNNTFEVCSMMSDGPPLVKLCLPLISRFAPDFIHECPYQGKRVGVANLPIDFSLLPLVQLSNFPNGEYRTVILFLSSLHIIPFKWLKSISLQDVTFYDRYWNIIAWHKLYGTIQQKRFSRKHRVNNSSLRIP